MAKHSKDKRVKNSTDQPPRPKSSAKIVSAAPVAGPSRISNDLRQAVKDLGGDEDDLALIEGVDEDDEDEVIPYKSKGKGKESAKDEVCPPHSLTFG